MDMTCRCKGSYTCVACKVKRGDYKDWMLLVEGNGSCADCSVPIGRRAVYCRPCWRKRYYAGTLVKSA